jgi:type IV pilus assembly protein PilP
MMHSRVFGLLLWILALAGCGGETQTELKEWMREEAKNMRGKVPPLPELTPFPPVSYDGRSSIVPFSAQKIVSTEPVAERLGGDVERPREPLENFALEELRVAGVIVRAGVSYALISPPAPNKPRHITVGQYMGKNSGRVASISTEEIRVIEAAKDNNGVWLEREIIKPVPRQGDKK